MGETLHFAGVAGSGMSALAQFHVARGGRATGSDRFFDRGEHGHIRRALEAAGVQIVPQDGSGLAGCDGLVVSTAVEETVPDVAAARRNGVPILHRSDLLARFVAAHRTIAITGTSGKSTVTAMTFEILAAAGLDPSVLSGAELPLLQARGLLGNAYAGSGELLVIEADESDGSVVKYLPWMGLVLNLHRDHKEPAELLTMFQEFRRNTRGPFAVSSDAELDSLGAGSIRFGIASPGMSGRSDRVPRTVVEAADVRLLAEGSFFRIESVAFDLPVPGLHNVFNAVASTTAALQAGVSLAHCAEGLRSFGGVARRFQSHGVARGIEVVDDFAHNPHKIEAALRTAQARGERVLAIFQPHGFGPTRFIRDELVDMLARTIRPTDVFWMLEIFYAGGTAQKNLSSRDIVRDLEERNVDARFAESRKALVEEIARSARTRDLILVMGARDPSLPGLCEEILDAVRATAS
ncbi:MAG: UDP-N-acetylmuramate--alanine ligase [Candidatus Eisenbacteria bacterium]|uniref:UDP-N-acetylmuramate--alanine ligase n=1 Tax=Eiseniibacteriota bacterium TaxID=2212470 RepID=A0A956LWC4_UNCEI|nr:UDP-N-acetylmuramate--alanine ligase [Candidatus Eisenbacteria bacterium]